MKVSIACQKAEDSTVLVKITPADNGSGVDIRVKTINDPEINWWFLARVDNDGFLHLHSGIPIEAIQTDKDGRIRVKKDA